ncbi:MAG: DUF4097 family beta strand repeat-containing protein [Ekhidna sp.]
MKRIKIIALGLFCLVVESTVVGQNIDAKEPNVVGKFQIQLTKPWLHGLLNVKTTYSRISVETHKLDYIKVEVIDLQSAVDRYRDLSPSRWDAQEVPFFYSENENEVVIKETAEDTTGLLLRIKVPESFSAKLDSEGESIFVFDLAGQVEAVTITSDITLTRISGSTVVNSESGNINASYKDVSSRYPHALSTTKGNIKLVLPSHSSTHVFVSYEHGKVASEFSFFRKGKSERGDNFAGIKIGSGEASIGLTTYYGDVNIYKN